MDGEIEATILALLSARAETASICPSDVARSLGDGDAWRQYMGDIRRVAASMAQAGTLRVTQAERALPSADLLMAVGPVRLRRGPAFPVDR